MTANTIPADQPAIGIVGAGAWGTALAQAAARAGNRVVLWARDTTTVEAIRDERRSAKAFPDIVLEPGITSDGDLSRVLEHDIVLLVVPAQALGDLCASHQGQAPTIAIICAKGFEQGSDRLMSEVVENAWPSTKVCCLSGPSFAAEVARGLPTALTLAALDADFAKDLAARLSGPQLRVYWTDDRTGVEIGGALKNVLAIAAGLVIGKGLGENARAALLNRGLAELKRLGSAMGARAETLMGLSGLGDLMLTAMSPTSRNTAFGMAVGGGRPIADALRENGVVEGYWTAGVVAHLAEKKGIDAPVSKAVADILSGQLTVDGALSGLMQRPLRAEAV